METIQLIWILNQLAGFYTKGMLSLNRWKYHEKKIENKVCIFFYCFISYFVHQDQLLNSWLEVGIS